MRLVTWLSTSSRREKAERSLREYRPYWPICAAKAMYLGVSVDEVYQYVKADRFFLRAVQRVVEAYKSLEKGVYDLEELKLLGFSDRQIAEALYGAEEEPIHLHVLINLVDGDA